MKIQNYVKKHWADLPKSTINENDIVIVKEIRHDDSGWGNHSYEGIGVDASGKVMWCFSSGCSCSGNADMKPAEQDFKVFESDHNLDSLKPEDIDFKKLVVHFSDY